MAYERACCSLDMQEYLHFRAVVLTNTTLTTLGLGLTIPLAFAYDYLGGQDHLLSVLSLLGASFVLLGFVLAVLDNGENESVPEKEDRETKIEPTEYRMA